MQTTLNANCVGSLAVQAVRDAKSGMIGEVISVFPNSLYIRTPNQELIFVSSRHLRSPITINLDSKSNLQQIIRPRAMVSLRENRINVGESISIDLTSAAQWDQEPATRTHRFPMMKEKLHFGTMILMIVDNHLSVLDQHGLAHTGALKWVANGILPLRESNGTEHFLKAAKEMVGLGMGFTPSGDDLLGGFLATYNSFAKEANRRPVYLEFDVLKNSTNWISAKLLDYLQRRLLDEQLSLLVNSAGAHGSDRFILALETLLPRGHTSGIDILAGVLLALGLLYDSMRNGDMTITVVKRLGLFPEDSYS